MYAVVVTGLPGSGKTTLATPLAHELGIPLLARDEIKELLADALGVDGPGAEHYGPAATRILLGLAASVPEVVLEAFFHPGLAEPELLALDRQLVQVHCSCPPELARERFLARHRDGSRHPVHHAMDDWERFSRAEGRLDLPAPLIDVDTTTSVDAVELARQVRAELANG